VNVKLPQLDPLVCCYRQHHAHCLVRAHSGRRVCPCTTFTTTQAINGLACCKCTLAQATKCTCTTSHPWKCPKICMPSYMSVQLQASFVPWSRLGRTVNRFIWHVRQHMTNETVSAYRLNSCASLSPYQVHVHHIRCDRFDGFVGTLDIGSYVDVTRHVHKTEVHNAPAKRATSSQRVCTTAFTTCLHDAHHTLWIVQKPGGADLPHLGFPVISQHSDLPAGQPIIHRYHSSAQYQILSRDQFWFQKCVTP
jgi:hypothetical protein